MLLIDLTAFLGNLMVLIAVTRNSNLRHTIPNMYIITLALSDFLMSITGTPFTVASVMLGRWPFGQFVCQFQGFCVLFLCAVSLETLALIAINRYFRSDRPQVQYRKIFTIKSTGIMIGAVWLLGFLAPFPYLVAGNTLFFHPGKGLCAHDQEGPPKSYGTYLYSVYVGVPLCIMIVCFTKVFRTVRANQKNLEYNSKQDHPRSHKTLKLALDEINITHMLLIVILCFLICWFPVVILDMIGLVRGDRPLPQPVYLAYTCFGYASAAVKPIIYGIRNRTFRREFYKILTDCFRKSRLPQQQDHRKKRVEIRDASNKDFVSEQDQANPRIKLTYREKKLIDRLSLPEPSVAFSGIYSQSQAFEESSGWVTSIRELRFVKARGLARSATPKNVCRQGRPDSAISPFQYSKATERLTRSWSFPLSAHSTY